MTLLERLRRLLDIPAQLDRIEETLRMASTDLDTLQASVDRNGQTSRELVGLVVDQRGKLAALTQAVEDAKAGQVDPERLAAIAASIDATTDAMAQALAPVVEDPEVPTGDVEVPAPTNPETPAPESVEGSVPAGEPLPEQA